MSSRTRAPRARAFKLPVVEEPLLDQKIDEPQGSNIRKSKDSPAGPSHGTKSEEPKLFAALPHMGTKAVEPKIATSPHEETVAVPSSEKHVFKVVSIEGVDLADFNSDFSDSECDGSMEEDYLLSDDDEYWYDPFVGKIHVRPGLIRIL